MKEFYERMSKKGEDKPVLMTVLSTLFYLFIGLGFVNTEHTSIITLIISCILCLCMVTITYAINKGEILRSIIKSAIPFAVGAVIGYFAIPTTVKSIAVAAVLFIIVFVIGFVIGKALYGKYIK